MEQTIHTQMDHIHLPSKLHLNAKHSDHLQHETTDEVWNLSSSVENLLPMALLTDALEYVTRLHTVRIGGLFLSLSFHMRMQRHSFTL